MWDHGNGAPMTKANTHHAVFEGIFIMRMRTVTLAVLMMLVSTVSVARADLVTIVDNTGAPYDPAAVTEGGAMYYSHHLSSHGQWGANAIYMFLPEPMSISRIAGVMSHYSNPAPWATAKVHVNVFSSAEAFGENKLQGDVLHLTEGTGIANLELDPSNNLMLPPLIGSNNVWGWPNRWVEFDFEPFELPAGEYYISVQLVVNLGWMAGWTSLQAPNTHPPDIAAHYGHDSGEWLEQSTFDGTVSGNAAAIIQGTAVATPKGPIGDLNGDGSVNVSDLLILLGQWGACTDCAECPADLNDTCTVNVSDLLILLANWG